MDLLTRMAADLSMGSRNGPYRPFNGLGRGNGSGNVSRFPNQGLTEIGLLQRLPQLSLKLTSLSSVLTMILRHL
ncbi:hypothetical protein CsatB_008742 [Cannabis sativa]